IVVSTHSRRDRKLHFFSWWKNFPCARLEALTHRFFLFGCAGLGDGILVVLEESDETSRDLLSKKLGVVVIPQVSKLKHDRGHPRNASYLPRSIKIIDMNHIRRRHPNAIKLSVLNSNSSAGVFLKKPV